MTESSKPGLSTRTIHGQSFKGPHGSPHTSAWRWNNLPAVQKIVDVARALGYDSPRAFATMFKRQFGSVPSSYFRRQAKLAPGAMRRR